MSRRMNDAKTMALCLTAELFLSFGFGAARAAEEPGISMQVQVRETKGLAREGELVRVTLSAPLPAKTTLCVTDDNGKAVPSQVGQIGEESVIWFAADVPAQKTRVYNIKPGPPAAPDVPIAIAGLTDKHQETVIRNRFYTATLMPRSSALNALFDNRDPSWMLYNESLDDHRHNADVIGPIHWTPDVDSEGRVTNFTPPTRGTWVKSYEWPEAPGLQESRGPLLYRIRRRGLMPGYPEIDAEVIYHFSAMAPEIIVEETITMVKDLEARVLRNGEWFFKSTFTDAKCKDQAGKIHEFPVVHENIKDPEPGHHPIHPEDQWLAAYDSEGGLGFAIVRMEIRNTGPAGTGYQMFISHGTKRGGLLEIARFLIKGAQKIPAGNTYYTREAIFTFDAREKDAFKELDLKAERLRNPLEVKVKDGAMVFKATDEVNWTQVPAADAIKNLYPKELAFVIASDGAGQTEIVLLRQQFKERVISVKKDSPVHKLISKTGVYTVCEPSKAMEKAVRACDKDAVKFKDLGLETLPGTKIGVPLLKGGVINYECQVTDKLDVGDSTIFDSKVVAKHIPEERPERLFLVGRDAKGDPLFKSLPSKPGMPETMKLINTQDAAGKPNTMPIGWAFFSSEKPYTAAVFIGKTRYSYGLIKESGEFVYSVPAEGMENVIAFCGTNSGKDKDKFKELSLKTLPATKVKPPLLKGSVVNLECKVVGELDWKSHTIFVGEIVAAHVSNTKAKSLFFWGGKWSQETSFAGFPD